MSINPASRTGFILKEIKNDSNNLDNLFKLAEKGDWGKVFPEVKKNPHLLNSTKDAEGITILLLAALHLYNENRADAFCFINKVFTLSKETHIPLNVNASYGGISVFWILLANIGNEALKGDWLKFDLIYYSLSHFNCNVNAAPKDGPSKDVTAYCLLAQDFELMTHPAIYSQLICDSVLPNMEGPLMTVPAALISLIYAIETDRKVYDEAILNNCYLSVLKIIKENPNFDVNAMTFYPKSDNPHKSLIETVSSMPSSPRQKELLLALIDAGAKPHEL